MALSLAVCTLASCGKKDDEEITRGSETIASPTTTTEEYHGEPTTDPNATTNKAGESTTAAGTTKQVTLADKKAEQAIQNISQSDLQSSGTTAGNIAAFIQEMGYDYDPKQGIFYTSLDNWQRQGNYISHYDTAAKYFNMRYRTAVIDFGPVSLGPGDNLNWRMQIWKGQYGIFGGCEVGFYTNNPEKNKMVYNAVNNDHMIQMSLELYLNRSDYEAGKKYLYREWQTHWWLTGFKFGIVDPSQLILKFSVKMKTRTMADDFQHGLETAGFVKGDAEKQYDTYQRQGLHFYILWDKVGDMNYIARTGS